MRRVVVVIGAAAALATALGTGTASADVHAISAADCAPDGVPSGAIESRRAIGDPGRPAAPIPVSASPFDLANWPGNGGAAPAQGKNC